MKNYKKMYIDELTDEEYFAFFDEIEREKYGDNEFRLYFKD